MARNTKRWSNAKRVKRRGKTFDSQAEADYFFILEDLRKQRKIKSFERQVRFTLPDMDGGNRFSYTVDYVVTKLNGEEVYIEVKGRFMPGNKLRYAYWQYVYDKKLTVVPTSGIKKLNTDWLEE